MRFWSKKPLFVNQRIRLSSDGLCINCGHLIVGTLYPDPLMHFIIIDSRSAWSNECNWSRDRKFCDFTDPMSKQEVVGSVQKHSPAIFLAPKRLGRLSLVRSLVLFPTAEETNQVKL